MRIYYQWAEASPVDYRVLASAADWGSLQPRPLQSLNVQGVELEGWDHYHVGPLGLDGARVTTWNDSPLLARVHDFLPIAPDPKLGGAYNTCQTVTWYHDDAWLRPDGTPEPSLPFNEFVPPAGSIPGGKGDAAAHRATRSPHHWTEWADDPEQVTDQRAKGRYHPSEHTITWYQTNTDLLAGFRPNAVHRKALADSPPGSTSYQYTAAGSATSQLQCFTGPTDEPLMSTWPYDTGNNYRIQINILSTGANLECDFDLFRVNSAASSYNWTNWTLGSRGVTGLQLLSHTPSSGINTSGAESDRVAYTIQCNNNAAGSQNVTLQWGTSDNYCDGPWPPYGLAGRVSWPDHLNARVGPFEITARTNLTGYYNSNNYVGVDNSTSVMGQSFQIAEARSVDCVVLKSEKHGSPNESFIIEIRTDDGTGNCWSSTVLGSHTANAADLPVAGSGTWVWHTFSTPFTLQANTWYWICMRRTGSGTTDYPAVRWQDGSATYNGQFRVDTDLYAGCDLCFGVYRAAYTRLYTILVDKENNTIEAWRSIDGGDIWQEMDAANHLDIDLTTGYKTFGTGRIGSAIYVAAPAPTSLSLAYFDALNEAWVGWTAATTTVKADISGSAPVHLATRSNDTNVFLYNGATERISGTNYRRVRYATCTYDTYTWNLALDPIYAQSGQAAHFDARATVLGASDRVHMFWTASNVSTNVYHRQLTSGGSLLPSGGNDIISMLSGVADSYNVGLPVVFTQSSASKVAVLAADSVASGVKSSTGSSADTPSFATAQTVTTATTEVATSNPGALVAVNGKLYAFTVDRTSDDIGRNDDGGNNTWSSGNYTSFQSGTVQGISAQPLTGAIGVLYNDAGVVKFVELSLSTPVSVSVGESQALFQITVPAVAHLINPPTFTVSQQGSVILVDW